MKASMEYEEKLFNELREGSKSAFEQLYKRYYGKLYLHAYIRVKDEEVAKDLVHDLFMVIWQNRKEIVIKTKFSSYIYASIRNRVIDHISKEQSQQRYLNSLHDYMKVNSFKTDCLVREKMLAEQIEQVLESFSPRTKEIFDLSRKKFLTHKEIAKELNLSEHTVRGYIKTVLRVLRTKFGNIPWGILFLFWGDF